MDSQPVYLAFQLEPGGVLAWLLIGLIAGAVAGRVVRGRGYGCVVDILVGIAGAFIGGALLGGFIQGTAGFWESLVVALIGAIALLAVLRLVTGSRR
ncbi:MAG TPA: GlsB/YeaQ/YmgE family stress response membrane protein [Candidatus Dormibacteraeota bacterium]|nr:GlsB/YeaQ/YmgE family stress response membrane protein [Candidatus Dormibacteraeota bacterium]